MITAAAPAPVAASGKASAGTASGGGEGFMALLASLAAEPAADAAVQVEEGMAEPDQDVQPHAPEPVPSAHHPAFGSVHGFGQAPAAPAVIQPAVSGVPAGQEEPEAGTPVQPAGNTVPAPTAAGIQTQVPAGITVPVPSVLQSAARERTTASPVQAAALQATPVPAPVPAETASAPAVTAAAIQAAVLERPAAFRIPESTAPAAQAAQPAEPVPAAAPVQGQLSTPVTPSPAALPAAPAAHVPVPLQAQLAKPVFTLAAAGNGEHVMTMKVTPEELGTVTVRAVISPEGVRMELFASDAGREAVKAIMADLRRDLAGAGFNASLDLGTGARPDSRESAGEGRQRAGAEQRAQTEPGTDDDPSPAIRRMFIDGAASLDVLA